MLDTWYRLGSGKWSRVNSLYVNFLFLSISILFCEFPWQSSICQEMSTFFLFMIVFQLQRSVLLGLKCINLKLAYYKEEIYCPRCLKGMEQGWEEWEGGLGSGSCHVCPFLSLSAALFASSLLKQTLQTRSQVLKIEEKFSHLCILVPTLLVEKILNVCAGETATVNLYRLIVCFSGWQEIVSLDSLWVLFNLFSLDK